MQLLLFLGGQKPIMQLDRGIWAKKIDTPVPSLPYLGCTFGVEFVIKNVNFFLLNFVKVIFLLNRKMRFRKKKCLGWVGIQSWM